MNRWWRNEVAMWMLFVALGIALAALMGHLFEIHQLATWGNDVPMAVSTSVCLILITVSVLLRSRRNGKPDTKFYPKPNP